MGIRHPHRQAAPALCAVTVTRELRRLTLSWMTQSTYTHTHTHKMHTLLLGEAILP